MYELPDQLPNDYVPKKEKKKKKKDLGNLKKIPEMLGFDGEFPAVNPKAKFRRFLVKSCKKSAVKHSVEKHILLNFVNLSPTFCPRLYLRRQYTTFDDYILLYYFRRLYITFDGYILISALPDCDFVRI